MSDNEPGADDLPIRPTFRRRIDDDAMTLEEQKDEAVSLIVSILLPAVKAAIADKALWAMKALEESRSSEDSKSSPPTEEVQSGPRTTTT